MTLANPFNIGMAIGASGTVGQVSVGDVVLAQAQVPDDEDVVEGIVGSSGGELFKVFYEEDVNRFPPAAIALAFVYDDALRQEAIPLKITQTYRVLKPFTLLVTSDISAH